MKKIIITILIQLLLLCELTLAQEKYLRVIDQKTKEPVAYANIWNSSAKKGTYSNEKGYFEIAYQTRDTLQISAVGYDLLAIATAEIKNNQILLTSNTTLLDEVVIYAKKEKEGIGIGFFKDNPKKKDLRFYRPLPMMEWAVFVQNDAPDVKRLITSINLNIRASEYLKGIYRVHLYSNQNFMPHKTLTNNNLIITDQEVSPNNTVMIDVAAYNLLFPSEGIFIGVECMGFIDPDSGMIITASDNTVNERVDLRKKSMSLGFIETEENHAHWKIIRPHLQDNWSMPDSKKANGYGKRFAFGITVVEVDEKK